VHPSPKKHVLFVDQDPEAIAKELHLSADRVRALITSGMERLKAARERRPMPAVDRTIFASWNGMMIAAVLEAAMAFGREDVRGVALKSLGRGLSGDMPKKRRGGYAPPARDQEGPRPFGGQFYFLEPPPSPEPPTPPAEARP